MEAMQGVLIKHPPTVGKFEVRIRSIMVKKLDKIGLSTHDTGENCTKETVLGGTYFH